MNTFRQVPLVVNFKEKPTFRIWCLYRYLVHGTHACYAQNCLIKILLMDPNEDISNVGQVVPVPGTHFPGTVVVVVYSLVSALSSFYVCSQRFSARSQQSLSSLLVQQAIHCSKVAI
jgi:hypothetical protein